MYAYSYQEVADFYRSKTIDMRPALSCIRYCLRRQELHSATTPGTLIQTVMHPVLLYVVINEVIVDQGLKQPYLQRISYRNSNGCMLSVHHLKK